MHSCFCMIASPTVVRNPVLSGFNLLLSVFPGARSSSNLFCRASLLLHNRGGNFTLFQLKIFFFITLDPIVYVCIHDQWSELSLYKRISFILFIIVSGNYCIQSGKVSPSFVSELYFKQQLLNLLYSVWHLLALKTLR